MAREYLVVDLDGKTRGAQKPKQTNEFASQQPRRITSTPDLVYLYIYIYVYAYLCAYIYIYIYIIVYTRLSPSLIP